PEEVWGRRHRARRGCGAGATELSDGLEPLPEHGGLPCIGGIEVDQHKHQRSCQRTSSRAPTYRRTYFAATGSAVTSAYSSASTTRCPPSRGMFPKVASG